MVMTHENHETNTPPACEQCGVVHDDVYWRHPELYHLTSKSPADGSNWYGDGKKDDKAIWAKSFRADVQQVYTRNSVTKLLCQHCRKPFEDAAMRNEKISQKNAKLEAAGQMRLPGW